MLSQFNNTFGNGIIISGFFDGHSVVQRIKHRFVVFQFALVVRREQVFAVNLKRKEKDWYPTCQCLVVKGC